MCVLESQKFPKPEEANKIVLTENATEFHFVGRLQKQYTTDLS